MKEKKKEEVNLKPQEPKIARDVARKEPWEMTEQEYRAGLKWKRKKGGVATKVTTPEGEIIDYVDVKGLKPAWRVGEGAGTMIADTPEPLISAIRIKTIKQAIREGKIKSHPDYPDLKSQVVTTKPKGKKKLVGRYLDEEINYGGEIRTRGAVIAEMQKQGTSQKLIDAYMMGAKKIEPPPAKPKAELPPHLQIIVDKVKEIDRKRGYEITDVTSEGYGPAEVGESISSRQLTTEQNRFIGTINEAKTILKGDVSGDRRAAIERSLIKTEKKLEATFAPVYNDLLSGKKVPPLKVEAYLKQGGKIPATVTKN